MPAADSRCTIRMNRSILSHDSVTCGGSPEVSSTAFSAQPPNLPPVCLGDAGFAVLCQLAPPRRPHHPVLVHRLAPLIHASFRPRLATAPLRFSSPSPPPAWAGDFHPQAVEHVRHTKKTTGGVPVANPRRNQRDFRFSTGEQNGSHAPEIVFLLRLMFRVGWQSGGAEFRGHSTWEQPA
jgi:hypothetical protein